MFAPSGSFDSKNCPEYRIEIAKMLQNKPQALVVDLKKVTFIDTNGLGTLFGAIKLAKANRGRLILCSLNEQIKFLLEATMTAKYFEIFTDRQAALEAIQKTSLVLNVNPNS